MIGQRFACCSNFLRLGYKSSTIRLVFTISSEILLKPETNYCRKGLEKVTSAITNLVTGAGLVCNRLGAV